ncbi:hypothetical protein CYL18_04785 [Pradoshia eiseniae]|uniref:Uncharacterized protein n=1 Tax=Pradoshia eiseniae TaxID=2064768 RepID=A0A2S7N529_9BACI|nr:hypothetical protein CYL18_04785 [Pradoshia eiseniae]
MEFCWHKGDKRSRREGLFKSQGTDLAIPIHRYKEIVEENYLTSILSVVCIYLALIKKSNVELYDFNNAVFKLEILRKGNKEQA